MCFAAQVSSAQTYNPSYSSIESIFGPLFPEGGICSSFRSEVGLGIAAVEIEQARVGGHGPYGALDLIRWTGLDKNPSKLDAYLKLRLWRFAYNLSYSYLQPQVNKRHRTGTLELGGLRTGLDFDVVQLNWMALGATVDFGLTNPSYNGRLYYTDPNISDTRTNVSIDGQKANTIGAYFRYVPPEIYNIPVHVEAYYKFPLYGSKLLDYGANLTFRPQIYRFDTAVKIYYQKNELNFWTDASNPPQTEWNVKTDWNAVGIDFAIYF